MFIRKKTYYIINLIFTSGRTARHFIQRVSKETGNYLSISIEIYSLKQFHWHSNFQKNRQYLNLGKVNSYWSISFLLTIGQIIDAKEQKVKYKIITFKSIEQFSQ